MFEFVPSWVELGTLRGLRQDPTCLVRLHCTLHAYRARLLGEHARGDFAAAPTELGHFVGLRQALCTCQAGLLGKPANGISAHFST